MPKYKLKEDGAVEGNNLPKGHEVILSELRAKPHLSILELVLEEDEPTLNETGVDSQPIEVLSEGRTIGRVTQQDGSSKKLPDGDK